jgi:hypothetical protein
MLGVRGYILVTRKSDVEVVALSGGRYQRKIGPQPPREISHASIEECFVHSDRAIKRALRRRQPWINRVVEAHDAFYDPKQGRVHLTSNTDPVNNWNHLKEVFFPAS